MDADLSWSAHTRCDRWTIFPPEHPRLAGHRAASCRRCQDLPESNSLAGWDGEHRNVVIEFGSSTGLSTNAAPDPGGSGRGSTDIKLLRAFDVLLRPDQSPHVLFFGHPRSSGSGVARVRWPDRSSCQVGRLPQRHVSGHQNTSGRDRSGPARVDWRGPDPTFKIRAHPTGRISWPPDLW